MMVKRTMTEFIGQSVGPYRILAVLGRGGMGVVYRAEDERLGREVALKVLPAEVADDPGRLSRFEREARAAGSLNHPNILTVHEVDTHQGQPFMVTELLEGSSLRQVIASGTLTVRKALDYGQQIAAGLAVAHDRGIVHRDLKPDNLFLNRDGRVTILDFGLAKLIRPDTVEDTDEAATLTKTGTGVTLGTPGYMAPEQVRALPTDHRSDIFALGVVLYEMVTGRRPFHCDTAADTAAATLREDPQPLSEVRPDSSPAVQRVIDRCLEKRADDRFQSAQDLAFALETLSDGGQDEAQAVRPADAEPREDASAPLPFEFEEIDEPERPVFVAREAEVARLKALLDDAIAGKGTVAFVTGEAGSGKTALVGEFCHRMQRQHDDLVMAAGGCSAQTGEGDAFAPWRQVLALLTGDVETRVASGAMTAEQGRRLWELAPAMAEAVVESGRDLVDTLLPGAGLLKRAAAAASPDAPWLGSMRALIERKAALPPDAALQQTALLAQYCRVVQAVAGERPLLLVLEDLHWADSGSIALLSALGHEISSARVLVVCTFRPEDVAQGRDGERHPLAPAVNELRRVHGKCTIEIGQDAERGFVDALLDSEPNVLGPGFREGLLRQTQGHALFTVELLRAMHDRGILVQDAEGRWTEGANLDWNTLPARVDAVIGERIERLSEELREALTIASVEGADFTAEVLARVRDTETRDTVRLLSRELEKRHRLVTARGIKALAEGRLSLYGFSHVLFQRYLYDSLDEVERAQLHEDVGEVLEALYGDEVGEIAPQLSRHFSEAGIVDKAIQYHQLAGDQAVRQTASLEAIGHLRHALDLVLARPEGPLRDRLELALRIQLHPPLIATCGWAAEEVGRVAKRAHELSARVNEPELVGSAMWTLGSYYNCRAEYEMASEFARQTTVLADQSGDAVLSVIAKWMLGFSIYFRGDLEGARPLFEEIVSHECTEDSSLGFVIGLDPRVVCLGHLSVILQILGYLDESRRRLVEAQDRARRIDHPVSESCVYWTGWALEVLREDFPAAMRHSTQLKKLAMDHGMQVQLLLAQLYEAVEEALGQTSEAAQGPELLAQLDATGYRNSRSLHQMYVALEHMALGQVSEALAVFDDALECAESLDEQLHVPPILISKAQLLLGIGSSAQAEDCLKEAISLSRDQHARLNELRASTLLARLWQAKGNRDEAFELLKPIYDWFTEGFDTVPLVEARKLLDELVEAQNE